MCFSIIDFALRIECTLTESPNGGFHWGRNYKLNSTNCVTSLWNQICTVQTPLTTEGTKPEKEGHFRYEGFRVSLCEKQVYIVKNLMALYFLKNQEFHIISNCKEVHFHQTW